MGNEENLKDLSGKKQKHAIFELLRPSEPYRDLTDQLRRLHELQEANDDNVNIPQPRKQELGLVVNRKQELGLVVNRK